MKRKLPESIEAKLSKIEAICLEYKIKELRLFGSLARGEFNSKSDIDLLYEFFPEAHEQKINFSNIEKKFKSLFKRKIDFIPKRFLKPIIRDRVLKESILIYKANGYASEKRPKQINADG